MGLRKHLSITYQVLGTVLGGGDVKINRIPLSSFRSHFRKTRGTYVRITEEIKRR